MTARRVDDPAELAVLLGRDRGTHVYGLADLDEPWWSRSQWWRRGDAAVGLVGLDAATTAFYAVSPADPAGALTLLGELADRLPDGAEGTGEVGVGEALAARRTVEPLGRFRRLALPPGGLVAPPVVPGVELVELRPDDADDLADLHRRAGGGVFFLASMLGDGVHVGARDATNGVLLASAGTHVVSPTHRVGAIGAVATATAARGRGLGAAVTHAVAAQLDARGWTVGLNVRDDNGAALRLYERLGFVAVHRHEEARVLGPATT